jgi:hypothetical protein
MPMAWEDMDMDAEADEALFPWCCFQRHWVMSLLLLDCFCALARVLSGCRSICLPCAVLGNRPYLRIFNGCFIERFF